MRSVGDLLVPNRIGLSQPHLIVQSLQANQALVGAFFLNVTVLENNDMVCINHCTESVKAC